MMNACRVRRIVAVAAAGAFSGLAASAGEVLWRADFSDDAVWETVKTFGKVAVSRESDAFTVGGVLTNVTDTAWELATKRMPLNFQGKCAVVFDLGSHGLVKDFVGSVPDYDSAIVWYGSNGVELARNRFDYAFVEGQPWTYRYVYDIPAGASAFAIRFGFDVPNFSASRTARFGNLRLERAASDETMTVSRPDTRGPRIRIESTSPTRETRSPVVVAATDPSGVVRGSVSVSVDGAARTDFTCCEREGGLRVAIPPPATGWREGLHELVVSATDGKGNVNKASKSFLIGDSPKTPAVTLRDDGMTLVGGEPFFPIGMYGVCKRDFNAYDMDRAVADLKAAGINTIHSYSAGRDPAFLAAAEKYGMKIWMEAHKPDKAIVETFRHSRAVIAWYLGDDTSDNTTPETLYDRDDNIRAIDPTRITTQADVLRPLRPLDSYWFYVPATDGYLPEIYPVVGDSEKTDRACVAQTVLEMKRIAEDQRRNGGVRQHSCWPIIQYFKGWGWKRFPTAEEFYAMSFASIIHGANGITFYTYGGFVAPEKNKFNYGVTSSEEVWRNTTNLTRRVASLQNVLVQRTPPQPPVPKVLSGPTGDFYGNPAVTALLKSAGGYDYLMTVNAADATVRARFASVNAAEVDVLWENRQVAVDVDGSFHDEFAPLGVHVYRWSHKEKRVPDVGM